MDLLVKAEVQARHKPPPGTGSLGLDQVRFWKQSVKLWTQAPKRCLSVRSGMLWESRKWVTSCPILSRAVLDPQCYSWGLSGHTGERGTPELESWLSPKFSGILHLCEPTQPLNLFFSAVQCW